MGLVNIFNDIEFKNDKNTTIIKWIVSVALFAIVTAFMIGQIKTKFFERVNDIEILARQNKNSINKLRNNIKLDVKQINKQIDKIYNIGIQEFEEYRIFNSQQLEMVIEFGQNDENANKELLKKILKLNSKENAKRIESQINLLKSTNKFNELPVLATITNYETGIVTHYVNGAPENYLDTLNDKHHTIIEKIKSKEYDELFDFIYIELKH